MVLLVGVCTDPLACVLIQVPFNSLLDSQAIIEQRFLTPGWQLWQHFDGTRPRLDAAVAVIDEYCTGLVRRRRAAGDCASRTDLLSRVMALNSSDGDGSDGGAGEKEGGNADADGSGGRGSGVRLSSLPTQDDAFLRDGACGTCRVKDGCERCSRTR